MIARGARTHIMHIMLIILIIHIIRIIHIIHIIHIMHLRFALLPALRLSVWHAVQSKTTFCCDRSGEPPDPTPPHPRSALGLFRLRLACPAASSPQASRWRSLPAGCQRRAPWPCGGGGGAVLTRGWPWLANGAPQRPAPSQEKRRLGRFWPAKAASRLARGHTPARTERLRFHPSEPNLQEKLTAADWLAKESAVLAVGAVAVGCMEAMAPHMGELAPYLLQLLNDPKVGTTLLLMLPR